MFQTLLIANRVEIACRNAEGAVPARFAGEAP
jgi:acetyl/propionyl-CoA carboxylase alpha subunit